MTSDPTAATTFKPFSNLSAAEVAVLPASIQFNVPYVTCAQLNGRAAGAIDATNVEVVACDPVREVSP